MSATTAALRGRIAAEKLMTDTCTITRSAAGIPTVNEATGQLAGQPGSTVYAGNCRVRSPNLRVKQFETEDRAVTVQQYVVSVPMAVGNLAIGDVVSITASVLDSGLVGRDLWIVDILGGSQTTARRLSCREAAS